MFCFTGDCALGASQHVLLGAGAAHIFFYRIAPHGDIGDLRSEVGTAGIAAPGAEDDGRVGPNNSGIARGTFRSTRRALSGNSASARLEPPVIDPFPASRSAQRKITPPDGDFSQWIQGFTKMPKKTRPPASAHN